MNERIKELAEQAGYHPDVFELCKPGMEKFAELIVRECANVVNDNDFHGSSVGDRMLFEHFGVEE